jgi:hypothetical protein
MPFQHSKLFEIKALSRKDRIGRQRIYCAQMQAAAELAAEFGEGRAGVAVQAY